jgi:aminoglycoside phosphotransferase (APT) family kinase protein
MARVDKSAITAALVSELITEQFPQWRDLPVAPVELDGWDNTTFRLGDDMLARLPSADCYSLQVEKEQRWLPVLARQLPLPIPSPLVRGEPSAAFPRPWSIYRWIPGRPAVPERVADLCGFAVALADFLAALYRVDPADGPPPGEHNFMRGGSVATYDRQTKDAIAALGDRIDGRAATDAWQAALEATWNGPPVWVHGDVAASNLLVADGQLSAVLDFGCCAVGDPACDLTIAWTFFVSESRTVFRERLALDDATWLRARGWALWKALITLAVSRPSTGTSTHDGARWGWRVDARHVIGELLDPTT